ncbi:hypothetical protein PYW08_010431 [Mythimna loreyi]|uniref:Uncharacterized protein n=1 Tax=Mythimna loreyi TaxID=667449 RepID=A0ACC2Q4G2_9NEOP|nr:hypothetical protein PYW08_010431 [Mythimna loreyi]
MESNKELMLKKEKRPKSPRTFPQRLPTYVVAFAVQETLDDPQKVQIISNMRSAENSTPSISPTNSNNSAKTFIISPTEQLSTVLNIATLSEVKIDILDDNQCGDVVEKKSPHINNYVAIDNNFTVDKQPEIVFNAPKHIKRHKNSNSCTTKKLRKRVINFKNIHFKYKKPKNSITRRLEKYYEKTKLNTPNSEQIQNQIYSNVLSQVVSRSQVLKKVLAKENLLADSDRISLLDGVSIFDNDNDSMNSSPSTTKKSFISYTSQKTLVRINSLNSSSSRNEDLNSLKATSSIIQLSSNKHSPYKSDIINVSLAVAYTASKTDTEQIGFSSNETLIHRENLTSSETFVQNNTTELTSKPPSSDGPNYKVDYDDLTVTASSMKEKVESNEAQEAKSAMEVRSDEDTFVIAKTSSDFNKSSIRSDCTLTFNSETTFPADNVQSSIPSNVELTDKNSNKTTLLDKVKFLGFYPTKTPSVGSNLGSDLNDVLVADSKKIINDLPITSKNITNSLPTDTQKVSVLRKPIDLNNMTYLQNNISLPNDVTIRTKLIEVEEARRSSPDNVKNKYPTDLAEMWDRLTIVLDIAVKRLEDTLADKISKEIKESLAAFKQVESKIPTVAIQRMETTVAPVSCDRPIPTMLHKEIFAMEDHFKRDVDFCVQCDLVQKQVIDQLMLKLSAESPRPIPAVDPLKILQPTELLKDHLEVLKPPAALAKESASTDAGKVDTVTVSTATTALSNRSTLQRFERLFAYPLAFLRENVFVLLSVPTFFIVMLCLYGFMVLIMNP